MNGDKLADALREITRTPVKPFPDAYGHSWEAFGKAVHAAWCDIQRIARQALAAHSAQGVGNDSVCAARYRFLRDESDCDSEQPYVVITRRTGWGNTYDQLLKADDLDREVDVAWSRRACDG